MKRITTLPAAFLFSSVLLGISAAADETYQLAKKAHVAATGSVLTSDSTMSMKDSAVSIDAGGQEIEGKASRTATSRTISEVISPTKIRTTVVKSGIESKMVINGRDQDNPEKSEPLLNTPVILELKDGKWSATLEKGEPTAEQKEALKKRETSANRETDFEMYGETPRKVGDEWKVDPNKIGLGDTTEATGDYTVKFMEVKDVDGVKCAVLKATFDFKGKMSEEGEKPSSLAMKGEGVAIRAIADMTDLEVSVKGTMTIDLSPAEGVSVHIVGPSEMTEKNSVKKP